MRIPPAALASLALLASALPAAALAPPGAAVHAPDECDPRLTGLVCVAFTEACNGQRTCTIYSVVCRALDTQPLPPEGPHCVRAAEAAASQPREAA